ncbi:MAG TPA: hypothetical protein VM492_15780 [Sumerlaeia bacterium]|nr:hypothetical protein [Sumerlaeia bacterium]
MEQQYTFEDLSKKTVEELRQVATGIEAEELHGHSTMHKERLLQALCKILKIDAHAHHVVVGVDKRAVKGRIQELKAQREAALKARDHGRLKRIRRKIHRLKREIHKATV